VRQGILLECQILLMGGNPCVADVQALLSQS
jgi:hypothetical protein